MRAGSSRRSSVRLYRGLLLAGAVVALLGILAGLARLGWNLPLPHRAQLTVQHGPLLVLGFFVTLIALERAVAVGRRFVLLAPSGALAGTLARMLGAPLLVSDGLNLLALSVFAATFWLLLWKARTVHHFVMFAGALAWLVSGILLSTGQPLSTVTPWWLTGFVLIITGERLELARVLRPDRRVRAWFFASVSLLSGATVLELAWPDTGARLRGLAFLLLSVWLLRYDVARRTLRQPGMHRYSAVCLLHGYLWLALAGLLAVALGHRTSGFGYDAQVHAVALGFVFSQVFAHAPIILPAVAGIRLAFHRLAYAAPVLLGLSLSTRVLGDLTHDTLLRRAGGLGNALALAVFALSTAAGVWLARRNRSPHVPPSVRLASRAARGQGDGGEVSDAFVSRRPNVDP